MQRPVFIKGTHVDLVVLTEDDARDSDWFNWFNDERVTREMQKHYFPNTPQQQVEFFRNQVSGSSDRLQLGLVPATGENRLFGVISLQSIDRINRKAEISMVVGLPEFRKTHFTLEAISLIINHGFRSLNLERIYGGTIIKELATLLNRSLGFQQEGVLRKDVYKDGEFRDVYRVGLLRKEFVLYSPGSMGASSSTNPNPSTL
jgi:RimJ/RimL family protein N-acetyltransferase